MDDDEIGFEFLEEVGRQIRSEFSNDPNEWEWVESIQQYYNDNGEYPDDISTEIINRLTNLLGDEENELISNALHIFGNAEDNIEYFYEQIFSSPNEDDDIDDDIKTDEIRILSISDGEGEEAIINESELDPKSYFEYHIKQISKNYNISDDFSYLLLNHFNWKEEELQKVWFDEQFKDEKNKVLKKLRVQSLKSELFLKEVPEGECPICYGTDDVVELYCGHKICKECLKAELLEQIDENLLPICRGEDEDEESKGICGATITRRIAQELLDENELKKFDRLVLSNEITNNPRVRECPNPFCDWIITPANRLSCNVGRCHNCNAVTCLNEVHDSHAPLSRCDLIDRFKIVLREDMKQLEEDQESWFAREDRLKEYRFQHQSEVKNVLNNGLNELKMKQQKEINDEMKRINEIESNIELLQVKLSSVADLYSQRREKNLDEREIQHLRYQMDDIEKEMEFESRKKKLFQQTHESKNKERKENMNVAIQEVQFFEAAVQGSSYYQFYISKFRESQDVRAYSSISITQNDDDYVNKITRKCPKCRAPILRDDGCNYMACNNCRFEFCWVCDQPWVPPHGNHFECPVMKERLSKIKSKKSRCGIDFSNLSDKTFYPQPMSIEKRSDFIRYHNLLKKFNEEEESYNKLKNTLLMESNSVEYSTKKALQKAFRKSFSEKDSNLNAFRIINTALFAKSIIMWGYPMLYFMAKDPQKAKLFEFRISQLQKDLDDMIQSFDSTAIPSDLLRTKASIEKEIAIITDEAEVSGF